MSPYTHLTSRTKEIPLFDLSGKEQAKEGLLNSASFEKEKQKMFWHGSNTCQHLESGSKQFRSSRLAWAMGDPGQVQDLIPGAHTEMMA